jgi:catalase
MPEERDLFEQIVEAVTAVFGVHEGRRALHAKGLWCEGTFQASPVAAELCRAAVFSAEEVPALVRFSHASGNPEAHDAQRDGRGMAVKLRPEGGDEWDIVSTLAPVFVARTPEDFLELMRLRKPDPETGQPDMEGLGEYLGRHPEAQLAIQSVLGKEPPASYATIGFFGPHAFRLEGAGGQEKWVRLRWEPEAGEERIPDDDARAKGRDYLAQELEDRLHGGPAAFDLVLQIAAEGDSLTDPTEQWPDDRETVMAGRLEVSAVIDDPEQDGHIEVFDPTRVPDGVEPSDDPILHARPRSYSVSAYRRLGEEPEHPSQPPPK